MYHLLPLLWSRSHASDLLLHVDQIKWYMYLISHVRQSEGLSTYPESLLLKPSLLILWFWSSLLPLFAAITPSKALQKWSVTSLWIFFVAVRSSYNPAVVVDHFEISGNIIFFKKNQLNFRDCLFIGQITHQKWLNYIFCQQHYSYCTRSSSPASERKPWCRGGKPSSGRTRRAFSAKGIRLYNFS